ncbi:MAG: glycerol-3-phosphate 1-O-acyltransferase PlsY [Anaerolineales bacterium]
MPNLGITLAVLAAAYLLGSIPVGLIIVRLKTGKDIRQVESGRTGGTNAMRAAGFAAGFTTAMLDIAKSASAVWVARALAPDVAWLHALAPVFAVLGHNYSIFLAERKPEGGWRLRGGAGGAPAAGGAVGLWWGSFLVIVPLGAAILYFVGYASVATLSVGVAALLIFGYRAWIYGEPWAYLLYGLLVEVLLIWALRPNIQRLMNGTERLVGLRAQRARKKQ